VDECLCRDPRHRWVQSVQGNGTTDADLCRPSAAQLRGHPWLKGAKKKAFLAESLLDDMPPLEQRQEFREVTSSPSVPVELTHLQAASRPYRPWRVIPPHGSSAQPLPYQARLSGHPCSSPSVLPRSSPSCRTTSRMLAGVIAVTHPTRLYRPPRGYPFVYGRSELLRLVRPVWAERKDSSA
jgi:hypothetical protein